MQTQVTLVINTAFNMGLLSPEGSGKAHLAAKRHKPFPRGFRLPGSSLYFVVWETIGYASVNNVTDSSLNHAHRQTAV